MNRFPHSIRRRSLSLSAALAFLIPVAATAWSQTITTLVPVSYTTTQGSTGGQAASVLGVMDQAGLTTNSNDYVSFQPGSSSYAGYTTYTLSTSIAPISVTGIQILANYSGPGTDTQTWAWQIYDWVHSAYVTVGTNVMAPSHGAWKELTFNVWGNPANYVNASDGAIRVQLLSNNAADTALIDYQAVVVTSNASNPTTNNSYYVSKSGSDSNPGTYASPWLTIQHAANSVTPGSTVYVEAGTYTELVDVNVCGSASGGLIRFQSYPGQTATLSGSGITFPYSSDEASRGLVQITNCSYVTVEGFLIQDIKPDSGSVFPAAIAINGNSSYVQIRGNEITAVDNGTYGAHGIGVYGNSSSGSNTNMVIDGNRIHDLACGRSEALHIAGNVQNFSVTNNQVYNVDNIGIDALGFYGDSTLNDQARNGVISGNLIYNDTDSANTQYSNPSASGIYVDGGTQIVVEDNISHDNDIGIQVSSEMPGKLASYVTVRNNVIYHNRIPGLSVGGYSSSVGSATQSSFVNNTLFQNEYLKTGLGEVNLQYFAPGVAGNVFENNIVEANSQGILISSYINTPQILVDYNLYYTSNGLVSNSWIWNSAGSATLPTWQSATGNDLHSQYADPGFVQTSSPYDLFVNTGSPALAAGTNLGSSVVGTTDFDGQPRVTGSSIDLGAYEASATGSSGSSTGGNGTYYSSSSSNTLAGGAIVQTCSGCSNGQTVGYIGDGSGTLTFPNIYAAAAGTYSLTISYEDGDAGRSATLTVNGSSQTLSFTGLNNGDWTTPQTLTVTVSLNAGNNTVEFSNPSAYAPDIDKLVVQATQSGTTYLASASGNTLAGGAVVQTCSGCASGQKVGYIGEGGTLTFNSVSAASAGTHTVTISYEDGDTDRAVTVTANGTATTVNCPGLNNSNWSTPQTINVTVTLNAGTNTIQFGNTSGYAPDIDQIVVF